MNAIEISGLVKDYGSRRAVDGLDLTIREGELLSLLGVNGAGKTTTIKILSCLLPPTQGSVTVLGHPLGRENAAIKALIGVSPQETAVAEHLTVLENLDFLAGVHGLTGVRGKARVNEVLDQFSLAPVARQRAATLSGGWQRRLSIAMALIGQPRILFLDEPTLGLDVLARQELWQVIRSLQGKVTILLTTHYMEEAQALSDRVCIMNQGRHQALGTPEELIRQTGTDRLEDAFLRIVTGGTAQ